MADLKWTCVQHFKFWESSSYCVCNGNKLIAVPKLIDMTETKQAEGIYKYNDEKDEWEQYISYPPNFPCWMDSTTMNETTNELYIYGENGTVNALRLESKTFNKYQVTLPNEISIYRFPSQIIYGHSSLIIDGELHLFGGVSNPYHLKADNEFKFKIIHELEGWEQGNIHFGTVYVKNKRILYLFGGNFGGNGIWIYCIDKNEWKKLKLTLPNKMSSFGYCYDEISKNILIFGGWNADKRYYGSNILIWNIDNMTMKNSKIKCPELKFSGETKLISYKNNELIVFGYITQYLFELDEFSNVIIPSKDYVIMFM
eukprot:38234_1